MISKLKNHSGVSLIEVMIGSAIIVIVVAALWKGLSQMQSASQLIKDKAFASQKTIQMMEELRGLIGNATSGNTSVGVLDDYDDGSTYNPILSTRQDVTDPADPVSGNFSGRYLRQVSVIQLANEPLARRVYVRVYRASDMLVLSEAMSVLYTIQNQYVPTQVFDVYILALENVPGWWSYLSTMKPTFDNVIQDLHTRNPGLEFRTHWITRLSYGRDPFYQPYVNNTTYTDVTASPNVYFYPGLMHMPSTNADFYYYPASYFLGQVDVDGVATNSSSYSEADQFDHSVRYPDEVTLYAAATTYAVANGQPAPEISLRMLLEQMNSSSNAMQNLLLVNLHGELIPLPPLHNYSDAAKDPLNLPSLRVVTHPENLQYAAGSAVNLRVYAYVSSSTWNGANGVSNTATTTTISTVTVLLPDIAIAPASINVRYVDGNNNVKYTWKTASVSSATVTSGGGQTLITLYNSPVRCPINAASNTGLGTSARLYGMEYIPCPVGTSGFAEGTNDLTTVSAANPKNTARWVIQIAGGAMTTGQHAIETRIGSDLTTGSSSNYPTNLSRTYVWVNQTPPITEQYQFTGDPRHEPYADVKANGGYNWFFTSAPSGYSFPAAYSGYMSNGWNGGGGSLNFDVPRYFQLYRGGILAQTGVWTTVNGFSFFYAGMGGEMGYDSTNGFPNSLQIIQTPWVTNGGTALGYVNEITNDSYASPTYSSARLIASTDNTWVSMPWLGELYPDSQYSVWSSSGNLPTGAGNFYRANYSTFFGFNPVKRTSVDGSATWFNGNVSGGNHYYTHAEVDGTNNANIQTAGNTISQVFNFPLLSTISEPYAPRPFSIDVSAGSPPTQEWNAYVSQRATLAFKEAYYDSSYSSSYRSSAMISITSGTYLAYAVVNGLATQANFGTAEIAKLAQVSMIRAFMVGGDPSILTDRIPQIPYISITAPAVGAEYNNPSTISITWTTSWMRWDSQPYTETYPSNFVDPSSVVYNVKYSNNNGQSWYFVQDNAAATAGVLDSGHAATSPYVWDVSSPSFTHGNYIVRVEAYRQGIPLHYGYHQCQCYIQR